MPVLTAINTTSVATIDHLIQLDREYQSVKFSSVVVLNTSIEYVFLQGYKCWENFVEDIFVAYSSYNSPVSGVIPKPFLLPKTETHALDLLKLEKDYLDWTSPDNIISRAKICFDNHGLITGPLKLCLKDMRDAKKIRNCIAHGSKEANRIFAELSRTALGATGASPGEYLNKTSPDNVNNYNVYYLLLFRSLMIAMSK